LELQGPVGCPPWLQGSVVGVNLPLRRITAALGTVGPFLPAPGTRKHVPEERPVPPPSPLFGLASQAPPQERSPRCCHPRLSPAALMVRREGEGVEVRERSPPYGHPGVYAPVGASAVPSTTQDSRPLPVLLGVKSDK
ncbi:unnamed protein product, partial [Ectocarpus fasciculatus]